MAPARANAAMRFTPKNSIPTLGDRPSKHSVHSAMTRFHDVSPGLADELGLPVPHSYGLGLWRDSFDGHLMWGHPGGGIGGHSELWHLPHDGITIAVGNDSSGSQDSPNRVVT